MDHHQDNYGKILLPRHHGTKRDMKEDNVAIINIYAHFQELTAVGLHHDQVTHQVRMILGNGNVTTGLCGDVSDDDKYVYLGCPDGIHPCCHCYIIAQRYSYISIGREKITTTWGGMEGMDMKLSCVSM